MPLIVRYCPDEPPAGDLGRLYAPLRETMKRYWLWFKSSGRSFGRHLIWLTPILLLLIVYRLPFALENRVRYAGMFFELFGIVLAAYGLYDKGKRFQHGLAEHFGESWETLPPFPPRESRIEPAVGDSASVSFVEGKVSKWLRTPPDGSVQDRLNVLEENTQTLRNDQDDSDRTMNKRMSDISENVRNNLEEVGKTGCESLTWEQP